MSAFIELGQAAALVSNARRFVQQGTGLVVDGARAVGIVGNADRVAHKTGQEVIGADRQTTGNANQAGTYELRTASDYRRAQTFYGPGNTYETQTAQPVIRAQAPVQAAQAAPAQAAPVQSVQAAPAPVVATVPAPGATPVVASVAAAPAPVAPAAPAPVAPAAVAPAPAAPAAPAPAPAAGPVTTKREIEGFTTQEAPKDPEQVKARNTAIQNFVQIMANGNNDKKIIEAAMNALPKDVDVTKISYTVEDGSKNPDGSTTIKKFEVKDRLAVLSIEPRKAEPVEAPAAGKPAAAPAAKDTPAAVKLHDLPVPAANAPAATAYSNITKADMPKNLKQEQVDDLQKMLEQTGRKTGNTPHDGKFGEKSLAALKDACAKAGIADYKSVDFSDPKNADLIKLKESLAKEATAHAAKVSGVAAPAVVVAESAPAPVVAPTPQTAAAAFAQADAVYAGATTSAQTAQTSPAANALPSRDAMIKALTDIGHPPEVAAAQVASLVEPTAANRDAVNAALQQEAMQRTGITQADRAANRAPEGAVIIPHDSTKPGAEQIKLTGAPEAVVAAVSNVNQNNPQLLAGAAEALRAAVPSHPTTLFPPPFVPSGSSQQPAAQPAPAPELNSRAEQVQTGVDVAALDFNNLPKQSLPAKPVVPGQGATRMG